MRLRGKVWCETPNTKSDDTDEDESTVRGVRKINTFVAERGVSAVIEVLVGWFVEPCIAGDAANHAELMNPCGGGCLKAELINEDAVRIQSILLGKLTNEDLLPVRASTDIPNRDYDSVFIAC